MATTLEELNQKLGELAEKLTLRAEQQIAEEKKNGGADPETKEALARLNAAIDKVEDEKAAILKREEALTARLLDIETRMARGAQLPDAAKDAGSDDDPEMVRAMKSYWCKGLEDMDPDDRKIVRKALSVDSGQSGGYTVYPSVDNNIRMKLIEMSPVRELADQVTITSDAWQGPAEGAQQFSSGWVGERQTRSNTENAELRLDTIPVREIYARPITTQKLLDDAGFNVESWITGRLADEFALQEGIGFISGNNVLQPEGLLTNSSIAEVNSGGASTITAAGLMALYYNLPEPYARNSTWLMKRSTIHAIRVLAQTSTSDFLWQAGLAGGQPSTILDRPYREAIDMPAIAANSYPILFGDFKKTYLVVDRFGIRTLRNPYKDEGFVGFYTTKRVGGGVVMAEAMRKMKVAA